MLVTNGGKHAVYNTFQTLLDPGDEVLLPAPYWTTYPEAIALPGGVPVALPTTAASGFRVSRRAARGGPHAADEGADVRLAVEPDRRGVPAGRGRGDRALGARARHLGRHRRDLRAPHLRRAPVHLDARAGPGARRHLRRAQRRRQDLRDDRLAGRLDDRPARRHRGGHQPAVAVDVQRRQRLAAGHARRGRGRPHRGGGDAPRVRAAGQDDAPDPLDASRASSASSPKARSTASRTSRRCSTASTATARSRRRAELAEVLLDEAKVAVVPGEAFGAPGYCRALVRARRRRPRRGRPPHRRLPVD